MNATSSAVLGWISAAAVVTLISIVVTSLSERKNLNRGERAAAYAAFLDAFSRRQRAFELRDVGTKRGDDLGANEAGQRVDTVREDPYHAYCRIQVLGGQGVVEAALECVRLSDRRNHAFKNPAKNEPIEPPRV